MNILFELLKYSLRKLKKKLQTVSNDNWHMLIKTNRLKLNHLILIIIVIIIFFLLGCLINANEFKILKRISNRHFCRLSIQFELDINILSQIKYCV